MSQRPDLDRRVLLALLAASVTASGAPTMAMSSAKGAQTSLDLLCAGAMCTDRETAERIGSMYLAAYPEEREAVWADQRIAELIKTLGQHAGGDASRWERSAALQQADFESGDVVCVAGWLLSRLEARLCAVCALAAT